jgi:MFS family permease
MMEDSKSALVDSGNKPILEKCQSPVRWIVLLLSCVIMISNYYCYDNPAALKTQIDDYMGNPSDYETMFSLLYTVYSIPNIFLPFFGGYFVDKFGVKITLVATTSFLTIGQSLFALGLSMKSWPVMLLGRVVYGFGGESLAVANSAVLAEWFKGKELAFAFGLNLSIARLGSVANNMISPVLASSSSLVFAIWFGVFLCGGSVVCVFIFSPIDKAMDILIAKNKGAEDEGVTTLLLAGEGSDSGKEEAGEREEEEEEEEEAKFSDVKKFPFSFWILVISCLVVYGCVLPFNNIASSLLLERDFFKDPSDDCHLLIEGECQSSTNYPVDCPASDWYQPPLPYDVTVDGTYYAHVTASDVDCTVDAWSDVCAKEFCNRQDDAIVQASTVMSIPYIISACLSPLLGGFVDRFGLRAVIATIAPASLVVVHSLMAATDVDPIGPMVGQGLAYSGFAAVLWPSIPLVIPAKFTGLGYGVVTAIQNGGLAIFPLIIAAIYSDSNDHYIPNVEYFFVGLAVLGTLVGFYLNYYDYQNDSLFNSPNKFKEIMDAKLAEEKDLAGRTMSADVGFTSHEERFRALSRD